jgi:Uma2 family endonuclease
MVALIADERLLERLIAERQAAGADHHDEVWEGVYFMPAMPTNQHQDIVLKLADVLFRVVRRARLGRVLAGINLSDRRESWEHNYRASDITALLRGTKAKNYKTHWCGPADFLVEVTSPNDRTYEKIPFYSQLGVRELLIVNRQAWVLELHRWQDGELKLVGQLAVGEEGLLTSQVLPLGFRLVPGRSRPRIEVVHADGSRKWRV